MKDAGKYAVSCKGRLCLSKSALHTIVSYNYTYCSLKIPNGHWNTVANPWPHIMKWCFICFVNSLHTLDLQAPSQVTGVSLSKEMRNGKPSLRVNWIAPQSDVTISEYRVQYRRSGTTAWGSQVTAAPPATSAYLLALDAGTEYDVRVRAVSAAREGEWSEVQTERTFNSEHRVSIYAYS